MTDMVPWIGFVFNEVIVKEENEKDGHSHHEN